MTPRTFQRNGLDVLSRGEKSNAGKSKHASDRSSFAAQMKEVSVYSKKASHKSGRSKHSNSVQPGGP